MNFSVQPTNNDGDDDSVFVFQGTMTLNPASPWSAAGFATPMVGGISRLIKLGQERLLTVKKF